MHLTINASYFRPKKTKNKRTRFYVLMNDLQFQVFNFSPCLQSLDRQGNTVMSKHTPRMVLYMQEKFNALKWCCNMLFLLVLFDHFWHVLSSYVLLNLAPGLHIAFLMPIHYIIFSKTATPMLTLCTASCPDAAHLMLSSGCRVIGRCRNVEQSRPPWSRS